MPVGGEQVRFGPQGDPGTKIVVPWRRTTVFRRCEIVGFCFVGGFCGLGVKKERGGKGMSRCVKGGKGKRE